MAKEHQTTVTFSITIAEQTFALDPDRAVYWIEQEALIVADVHWGKDTFFRQHGVSVPAQVLAHDLDRLSALIEKYEPQTFYVLGDLVHNRQCLTPEVVEQITTWRKQHLDLVMHLIRGNHESTLASLPASWAMLESEPPMQVGPFKFDHEVHNQAGQFTIGGHVHPVCRLHGATDQLRLPCFYQQEHALTLPAFGTFTGGHPISPQNREIAYGIADQSIIALPG